VAFQSKTNTITVGPGSDFVVDSGAFFIKLLRDLALKPGASIGIRNDWRTISTWLGRGEEELTSADYERIGQAWRSYINRGVAPSVALEKPFQELARTKQGVRGGRDEVPPEVYQVFDRLMASDEEIREKRNYGPARPTRSKADSVEGSWRMRLAATGMLVWLPLSFLVVPLIGILGIRWIRNGWPLALLGAVAILAALPPAISILQIELRTLTRRPISVVWALSAIAYNTAILITARYLLE
jgi:hypothetical protein